MNNFKPYAAAGLFALAWWMSRDVPYAAAATAVGLMAVGWAPFEADLDEPEMEAYQACGSST